MPRRTQTFMKTNWNGGLNTLVDPGVLPDSDLVTADNVIFAASGSRLKREGIDQFDATSNIPAITHYASSTTTRTLTFASTLVPAGIEPLVVGEYVTIASTNATLQTNYGGSFYITGISTNTLTYTAVGSVADSTTASSTFTMARATPYIEIRDYWRMDGSYVKQQLVMAFSGQGKLFKFNSSGNRVEIKPAPEVSTVVVTNGDTGNDTNGDWFKIYDGQLPTSTSVGVYMKTSGGADTPPAGNTRTIQVPYATGATAGTIAAAIQVALDADSKFIATVNSTTVTITDANSGSRTNIADGTQATSWTFAVTREGRSLTVPFADGNAITRAASITLNERFIVCPNDTPIYFRPETDANYYFTLAGSPPKSNSVSEHLGRLWMNDIENRDRMHYSETGDPEIWQGIGDSGALDIGWGDGDPEGILAISPSFKGRLFVGKATKIYQVTGEEPLTFFPQPITQGLGVAGHKSFVAVEMDDLLFTSKEGVHSVSAVAAHGDYSSEYLSSKIQPSFDEWPQTATYRIKPTYIAPLNAVVFNVPELTTTPSALWMYDVEQKAWFRWPNKAAVSLCNYLDTGMNKRLLFSDNTGKLFVAENGDYTDADGSGGTTGYSYKVKTGTIYVDGNPQTVKGYKNISFLFRPAGRYSFTLKVWVDNLPVQNKSQSQGTTGDVLGTTFVLGSSVLGSSLAFAPVTIPIEGYGRGITLQIENANQDEQVEIYGFIIEYENADIKAEVTE